MDQDAREFLQKLGVEDFEAGLLDGVPPVPVDEVRLRAYFRRELTGYEREVVAELIARYRAWSESATRIQIEEAKSQLARERIGIWLYFRLLMQRRAMLIATAMSLIVIVGVAIWSGSPDGFRDGNNLVAFRDGRVTGLEKYGPEWSTRASQAYSGKLSDLEGLRQVEDAIRGVRAEELEKAPMIIGPYETAVRNRQPTLRWHMVEGVEDYQVEVRHVGDPQLAVGPAEVVGRGEWQVPVELEPDVAYEWRVSFTDDGDTYGAPTAEEVPAVFTVLSGERLRSLTETEQELVGSPLLLFLLYLDYGLLDEADSQLTLLEKANPDSEFVERLRSGWEEAN